MRENDSGQGYYPFPVHFVILCFVHSLRGCSVQHAASPPVRRRRRWFTCPLRPCWRCAESPSDSVRSRPSPM
ncbi:hypothetical protein SCOCK_600015 [Actinacidiphila cocklensis]|uniref:Uncharacterized protein n=1 Tax=Actinacidiphila cocklensis TaxID=887465 RepID=A0A9W4DYY5_9ACTN|nr:hypothetical protein SCOCK_600015 [Actinacidiphila cocklensis]